VGVDRSSVTGKPENYLLILAFLHQERPDEIFFVTRAQVLDLKDRAFGPGGDGAWGDLVFNRPEREEFSKQMIGHLPSFLCAKARNREA